MSPAREKNTLSPMTCTEEHEALINRRRYQRYEIDTQLQVTLLCLERGTLRGRSLNISEAGIAGVFVTVWDVGTPVHLEFSVPVTSSPLRVGGVLRSHSGYRYGFEFVDLNPEQREIINKTCRTLALLERWTQMNHCCTVGESFMQPSQIALRSHSTVLAKRPRQ